MLDLPYLDVILSCNDLSQFFSHRDATIASRQASRDRTYQPGTIGCVLAEGSLRTDNNTFALSDGGVLLMQPSYEVKRKS